MKLELEEPEQALLADLLEAVQRAKRHELHHTATAAYKRKLRDDIEIIERLEARLAAARVITGRT